MCICQTVSRVHKLLCICVWLWTRIYDYPNYAQIIERICNSYLSLVDHVLNVCNFMRLISLHIFSLRYVSGFFFKTKHLSSAHNLCQISWYKGGKKHTHTQLFMSIPTKRKVKFLGPQPVNICLFSFESGRRWRRKNLTPNWLSQHLVRQIELKYFNWRGPCEWCKISVCSWCKTFPSHLVWTHHYPFRDSGLPTFHLTQLWIDKVVLTQRSS